MRKASELRQAFTMFSRRKDNSGSGGGRQGEGGRIYDKRKASLRRHGYCSLLSQLFKKFTIQNDGIGQVQSYVWMKFLENYVCQSADKQANINPLMPKEYICTSI